MCRATTIPNTQASGGRGCNQMILKTAVINGSTIDLMETIEFEGSFWLVPQWVLSRGDKYIRPLRIISLATIPHQRVDGPDYQFVVNSPIAKGVLLGHPPKGQEKLYVIRENPEIVLPNPDVPQGDESKH